MPPLPSSQLVKSRSVLRGIVSSSRHPYSTTPPQPKPKTGTPILDTIIKVVAAGGDAKRPGPPQTPPMTKWDPASFDPSRASPVAVGDYYADSLLKNSGGRGPVGALDQGRSEWNKQLLSVAGRRWREGDLYTPRDLGPKEAAKWSFARANRRLDPFKMMGRNPLSFYKVRWEVLLLSLHERLITDRTFPFWMNTDTPRAGSGIGVKQD
jgi:hypothetical protein